MLLVGHGSHLSPASALPVHSLADEIRRLAGDLEVRVAFWKEEPLLHQAFDLIESRRVYVVPVFTSEGYFTDAVLPRELGLAGEETVREDRFIRYCPPVGTHPGMAKIVIARADEVVSEESGGEDAALVIVGHGTERHPRSARSTLDVADEVRATGRFPQVEAAFLDQDPTLDQVLGGVTAASVIVVPFFIAEGWHAGTTIPRDLGADAGASGSGGLRYAHPVGTHPSMAAVVLDLLADATSVPAPPLPASEPIAMDARRAFLAWIEEAGSVGREFLETVVWEDDDGRFEIRHRADRPAHPGGLATFEEAGDGGAIARTTDEGAYRPLSTAPNLRRGWRIVGLDTAGVWDAFAGLYPTAPVHWYLGRVGPVRTVGFAEAAGRQTGMYERIGSLGAATVGRLVDDLCGKGCLRVPRWSSAALPLAADAGQVPCLQPCSVFLSTAREALDDPGGSG